MKSYYRATTLSLIFLCAAGCLSGERVWKGELYSGENFNGEPIGYAEASSLMFVGEARFPFPDMPDDNFSDRWVSCLKVDDPETVYFEVGSDDGGRLFLDKTLVVNNWGAHIANSRTEKINLLPGVYKVTVEHNEYSVTSSIYLKIRFGETGPARLADSRYFSAPVKIDGTWDCE